MMRDWIEAAVFVLCVGGIILYSLPPDVGGPSA